MKTLLLVILIVACSVCILSTTANQANATYAIYSRISQTVASGNAVFVTWDQSTENNTYILFKKSLDGGTTFGKTLEIANNVGVAIDQRVAISQNNTYIAWGTNMDAPHIFFRKSSDYGNTFGPALILSDPYPICSGLHDMIATGSNVYVFFSCYNSTSKEGSIVFRASHDYGNTFQNPVIIFKGNSISSGSGVSAVVNASNIYLAFQSSDDLSHPSDVVFKSSHDRGMSFSDSLTLSNGTAWHTYPNVASFDNHVYVIWVNYDGTDFKSLLLRKSDDYGKTFGNVIILRETAPEFGIESIPSIIASDGKVYVKWQEMNFPLDSSEQKQSVMLTTISNNGNSFDTVSDVSGKQTFDLRHSEIASANHNLYLMWPNVTNPTFDTVGIFFKKSTDWGSTFGNAIDLNKNDPLPIQMGDPHLVASENNVYVTGDSVEKSHDIFFIASHDGGYTFGKMVNIDDFNPTGVIVPTVDSPLKQLKSGVAPENIRCQDGLELVINSQKSPACVRHVHLPRLLSNGWVYGIDDAAEVASKKIQDVLVIHDKIHEGDGLVPVTVTEVINHAESLDSVMDWSFIPIGYDGDNRGTSWDFIPNSYPLPSGVTDGKGNDVIDKSRMPENFAITLELRLYSTICGSTEKVMGEGGHPFSLPIKKGNPVVLVYSGGRGILPDSSGTYTVNFVSLFETKVEFPKSAHVISNQTQSCFLENKIDNFTKAFYTKAAFTMD
ncbi:MAG: sialidase family protein [Candidatus Nitrosotalea sp.]|nr:sialidase family protein [Candidatus Nitrosotalea sp.]